MKFGFIAKHRSVWPVAWLCEALGVSRSGFHAWLKRGPCARSREDEAIMPAFSRRVVGWSMKAEMSAQFVTDALLMAIWRRGRPDALLHHSDSQWIRASSWAA
jgi:transposase InsO family protein